MTRSCRARVGDEARRLRVPVQPVIARTVPGVSCTRVARACCHEAHVRRNPVTVARLVASRIPPGPAPPCPSAHEQIAKFMHQQRTLITRVARQAMTDGPVK